MSASIPTAKPLNKRARYIPILSWLPHYDRAWLSVDVIAGLTLWGLVVPEAMAYAGIAGLPPQAGLYTLLAALLVYALLGTSRHLVVQATSATAALLASSVAAALVATAAANASDPETYQAYASAFVLVTGLVFLAAGLARLGFITQFLSKPVMDGFVMGLAIFVAVGQLNKLFIQVEIKTPKLAGRKTATGAVLFGLAGLSSGGMTVLGGAVLGGIVGSLFHKGLGMSKEDLIRIDSDLNGGKAAAASKGAPAKCVPGKARIDG